jgi:ankyrin repeat protein
MTFEEAYKLIKRGDIISLRRELEAGLDPNLSNRFGWTILMAAAGSGNTLIGRLLITNGADLDRRTTHDFPKQTALSCAVQSGHPTFVELLLKSGASLDCDPDRKTLDIFLDWAARYTYARNNIDRIRALFDEARAEREITNEERNA